MKRSSLILVVCFVPLILLSACIPVEQQPARPIVLSDELLALLETVSAEHQAIVKPAIDEAAIVERWARDTSKYSLDYKIAGSMIDGVLTAQQAKNDVNVLFYNLQTKYGLYEYFGGDEVFDVARETILRACDEAGTLTPDELKDILRAHLAFIKDGHFLLAGQPVAPFIIPFHYRSLAFEKTSNGYQTIERKKQVRSVAGYENLGTLFRRSISNEGDIVYYPVVLLELPGRDLVANPMFIPEDLVVRFVDGTTQTLVAEPFHSDWGTEKSGVELYRSRGLPVLFSGRMGFDEARDQDGLDFLAYAEQLKDKPVVILDLRTNGGGNIALPHKWLHAYLGKDVTSNSYTIDYQAILGQPNWGKFHISDETLIGQLGVRAIGSGITLWGDRPDEFVANDNLIIALTAKTTGSAAEAMVDLLHNVNNVIFIGDTTFGCYVGKGTVDVIKLPFSQISASFGQGLLIFPDEDYFQEMRGFLPDLWVPAAKAEELAIKLVLNSK